MNRSKRMDTIVRLASQAERDAAQVLMVSRRDLEDYEQKLAHLRSCRREYADQLRGNDGAAISVVRIQELRGFIHRLDDAIMQLEQQVERKRTDNEQRQHTWLGTKHRTQALNGVADRYRSEEMKKDEVKQQLELDDRPRRETLHD